MTRVSLIVAHDEGGVIAVDGRIPWDLPEERSYFRRVTRGGAVVMGARTWETIHEPLPGRINVVLTKYIAFVGKGPAWVATSLDAAFGMAEHETESVFVIGGADVFAQTLPLADVLHLTRIQHTFPAGAGAVYFPAWNPAAWRLLSSETRAPDAANEWAMTFERWERR